MKSLFIRFLKRHAMKNILLFVRLIVLMIITSAVCTAQKARTAANPSISQFSIASYKITDVMPSFWQFWERAENQSQSAKTRLLRELIIQPNEKVYKGFTGVRQFSGI